MQLIYGNHRRSRVVDRWRERLDRDVDDDAEAEHRILLDGPLRSKRHLAREMPIVDRPAAGAHDQQRPAGCDEIADLWYQFQETAEAPRRRYQRLDIDRDEHP